jgi:hypothetical protein
VAGISFARTLTLSCAGNTADADGKEAEFSSHTPSRPWRHRTGARPSERSQGSSFETAEDHQ